MVSVKQNEGECLEEVVSKVEWMLERRSRYPCETKTGVEISCGLIFRIRNEVDEVTLGAHGRCGRTFR